MAKKYLPLLLIFFPLFLLGANSSVNFGNVGQLGAYQGSGWEQYSMTIGATTTAPTLGSGSTVSAKWRRNGPDMEILVSVQNPNAGSGGSGSYLFPLPSGYAIDTNVVTLNTAYAGNTGSTVGYGTAGNNTGGGAGIVGNVAVVPYNSTNLAIATDLQSASAQKDLISSSRVSLGGAAFYSFYAKVPISGWSVGGASSSGPVVAYSTLSSGSISSGAALLFATKKVDTMSAYNPATGVFTAPISGNYVVSVAGIATSANGYALDLYKNGSTYYAYFLPAGSAISSATVVVPCAAGDTLSINAPTGASNIYTSSPTPVLSIYRL